MVTARLAIGSVSVLALGALALGSAPYWLHRSAGGTHASPWGVVSSLSGPQQALAQTGDEQTQLLKLAALKTSTAAEVAPPAAPPAPAPVVEPPPAPTVQASAPATPAVAEVTPAAQPDAVAADAKPAEAPQQVASLDLAPPADTGADDGASKSDRININTASSSALDHLPGAGRIGRTIVSHRPYKTVKELVSRRVLRISDFEKIQSRISVD